MSWSSRYPVRRDYTDTVVFPQPRFGGVFALQGERNVRSSGYVLAGSRRNSRGGGNHSDCAHSSR